MSIMNEAIILSLANQARDSVPKMVLEPEDWIKQYNLIFGRLIIEECIQQASNARSLEASAMITRYFGVDNEASV